MADGLDRLDERLCNLIERLERLEEAAKQRHDDFRTECWRRFDWLESKLAAALTADELHIENLRGRIASLETWRGYITGGLALAVLLWGGVLTWLKTK